LKNALTPVKASKVREVKTGVRWTIPRVRKAAARISES